MQPRRLNSLLLLAILGSGVTVSTCDDQKTPPMSEVLSESWKAYVARFIQQDGRVIDYRARGISTSEGQAYAMLRAVWMKDRGTFDKTHAWAVNNLNSGIRSDHLWAWKWGQDATGKWQVLDRAFASDADQDAALALILAYRHWNEPKYLSAAEAHLADLWKTAIIEAGGRRYLLAGDRLCDGPRCKLNPSYCAPYSYRIFRNYDRQRNWAELVDSCYALLKTASALTETRLPPDWVYLDTATGAVTLANAKDSSFSYDAFRVFWRIEMDHELFKDPRAEEYLTGSIAWIVREWNRAQTIPAVVSSTGKAGANYASLEMLAGMMPALRSRAPQIASAMNQKLQRAYANGIWADSDSYYLQNWGWFGAALYQRYLGPLETFRGG